MGCAYVKGKETTLLEAMREAFGDEYADEHERLWPEIKVKKLEALEGFICGEDIEACAVCGAVAHFLCDAPVGDAKRCDLPLCEDCRYRLRAKLDVCPFHRPGPTGIVR